MKGSLVVAGFIVAIVTSGACGLAPPGGHLATTFPPEADQSGRMYTTYDKAKRGCGAIGDYVQGFSHGREYAWYCVKPAPVKAAPPADKPQGPN